MTTTITATHTVQFWVDSAKRAVTPEVGLENLRDAWRLAHAYSKDETMSEETRARAAVTKATIEAAGAQLRKEAHYVPTPNEYDRHRAEAAATRNGASREDLRQRRSASNAWAGVKAAGAKLPALPHAHYAIEEAGELHFFRVDKPQEGHWVGRTFVSIQASDEYHPIRRPERLVAILEAIAVDPKAAMLRYGTEIGRCGHCHRTLTNPESIQYGIGPICRSKMGW